MPRFGKEYKMFSKIIPSLELDITDLLLDSKLGCVKAAGWACEEPGDRSHLFGLGAGVGWDHGLILLC